MDTQHILRGATVLLLVAFGARDSLAQRTTFHPSIALGVGYQDNVSYGGEPGAPKKSSDTVTSLSLSLPVSRQWSKSSLSFLYEPSYYRYQEFDILDHDEHRAHADWQGTPNSRTTLLFATDYSRSQVQGRALFVEDNEIPDADTPLTKRTERTYWGATLSLGRTEGPRWSWGAALDWATRDHESIPGFNTAAAAGLQVENRDEYGGSVHVSRNLARSSTIGAEFQARSVDLESSDERTNSLRLTYGNRVGRNLDLQFALGAFRRSSDSSARDTTEFDGSFDLGRTFRKVRLGLSAGHRPTSGGHLPGTSTNTSLGLGLSSANLRLWQWGLASNLVRRNPSDDTESTDTAALSGSVERSFFNRLGVRLGASYTDQTSDDPLIEDISAFGADLALVYYPLGRTPVSRGSRAPRGEGDAEP